MTAKQPITIKSRGDVITILLDNTMDFESLEEALRAKVSGARQFFEGVTSQIAFKGRDISTEEEKRLAKVITTETTMRVILADNKADIKPPERPKRRLGEIDIPSKVRTVTPPNISYTASNTAYYHGGLRSGQTIKFDGSVVLMGDVNPGAEVIADGNIVILGALKGMAHAGANGNTACFVSALAFRPTQLRIAHIIATVKKPEKGDAVKASVAYANQDGKILIGDL